MDNYLDKRRTAVDGTWTGNYRLRSGSCTTDSNGVCSVSTQARSSRSSLTFTVDAVSHATLGYDPLANSDPDGDSDGSSITIARP